VKKRFLGTGGRFLPKKEKRLIRRCESGKLSQIENALSHGVAVVANAAFGVNSITAWLTQASGGAKSGRRKTVTVTSDWIVA